MSKKSLALALKFVVSGFLIWFLLSKIDLDAAKTRLAGIDVGLLTAAVAVILVQMGVGGARWEAVLGAIGAPLGYARAVLLFYIGVFFSQVLPSSVGGDAVRMYKAYRAGLGLRAAVNGVLLERAVTVVALVVLVIGTQPWFAPRIGEARWMMLAPGLGLLAAGAVGGLALLMSLDRLPQSLRRWRVVRGLGHLAADARGVFLKARPLAAVTFWGLATHLNMALAVLLLAEALDLNVTWLDCLVLVPPVLLITTLPISIGGWGVRENAMVVAFGLIGVPQEGAAVLGILMGLVGIMVGVPGGILWALSREKGETLTHPGADLPAAGEPPPPTPPAA
ncbi:MAG TPA: lysylphosphatidylglycerol synthase transmembrane domain-containing protein [Rhodospirillales bacterium]